MALDSALTSIVGDKNYLAVVFEDPSSRWDNCFAGWRFCLYLPGSLLPCFPTFHWCRFDETHFCCLAPESRAGTGWQAASSGNASE